jgi:TolB protein
MDLKKWWKSKFSFDADDFSLGALVVLSLLALVLLFVSGPCYSPYTPPPPATPTPEVGPQVFAIPRPAGPSLPRSTFTPTPADTPLPTPTPPGGGFRSIAFASNRADGRYLQLYLMDADGNHVERLTHSQAFDRDPHLAHDRESLAFCSNRDGGYYQIYVLNLTTRAVRRLTFGNEDKTNPIWSPDGRTLIFTWQTRDRFQLAVMNADGSEMRQLTDTYGDNHAYSFSPDRTQIAFESGINHRSEIYHLDLATRNITRLIQSDDLTQCGNPVFNPAGKTLLFTSDVTKRRIQQIYVLDLASGQYSRITHDDISRDDPIYSPDGTLISYAALWEGAWNIYRMRSDGTEVKNLTNSYFDNNGPTWR